ncbi:MAG: helix-turn-helix domain-containing protein [Xanthobacteraceae bacterium]
MESRNHVLLADEPAWSQFLQEFRTFVGNASSSLRQSGLTTSEHEVLALIARGLDNGGIADALAKSEKTVRNQVSSIFAKLERIPLMFEHNRRGERSSCILLG